MKKARVLAIFLGVAIFSLAVLQVQAGQVPGPDGRGPAGEPAAAFDCRQQAPSGCRRELCWWAPRTCWMFRCSVRMI